MNEITLSFERFEELIAKEQELDALHENGVESWRKYKQSIQSIK